jgi:putative membrane protein
MPVKPRLRTWVWPPPPVARRLWVVIAGASAYCLAVYLLGQGLLAELPGWSSEFGLVNGIVMGVLVAIRTRAAFDRWFEGQRLWGELQFHSRNLALKVAHLVRAEQAERHRFGLLVTAFAKSLVSRLRGLVARAEDLGDVEPLPDGASNAPAHIAGRMIALAARWHAEGKLDLPGLWAIESNVRALMDVAGHCDRVAQMPVPTSFHVLLRHGLLLSLVLAPWHLIHVLALWAVPVQALIIYFLFGIELTAEEIENPFGTDVDDLPLEEYCETVRRDVVDIIGSVEPRKPPPAPPPPTTTAVGGTIPTLTDEQAG